MASNRKQAKREASEGRVLLAAPKKVTSCSADGVEYKVGNDGFVEVAPQHAVALIDHGFTEPDFDEPESDDAPPANPPGEPPVESPTIPLAIPPANPDASPPAV